MTTVCVVTRLLLSGVTLVNVVPAPYSTCDVAGLSVVHVMVAVAVPIFDAATAETTGAVALGGVAVVDAPVPPLAAFMDGSRTRSRQPPGDLDAGPSSATGSAVEKGPP